MSIDALAQEGQRVQETPPQPSPLSSLHETYFELLRIEIVKHLRMGAGVVPRGDRRVLSVLHGETGQLVDIGIVVEGGAHWYTWEVESGDGRTIGIPAESAAVAASIVRVLSEGGRLGGVG